jgi:single-stranded DNA-binding protein
MEFSGQVRKPEVRDMGDKKILSFGLMRKNYEKDKSAEPTWTHVRFMLFDAKPVHIEWAKADNFIAGGGSFSMRSWVDKDGNKKQSADVRIDSFGMDAAFVEREQGEAAPAQKAQRNVAPAKADDSEPPF